MNENDDTESGNRKEKRRQPKASQEEQYREPASLFDRGDGTFAVLFAWRLVRVLEHFPILATRVGLGSVELCQAEAAG